MDLYAIVFAALSSLLEFDDLHFVLTIYPALDLGINLCRALNALTPSLESPLVRRFFLVGFRSGIGLWFSLIPEVRSSTASSR